MIKTFAATAVALLVTALAPVTAMAGVEPTRVLIVGDSVTQGSRGDYTWRYFLWRALHDDDANVDFVGRRTGVFHATSDVWSWDYDEVDAYADPAFDQDHSAWWGAGISPDNWLYDPIDEQVEAHTPDVVVSMWGINDLARDDRGPEDVISTYRDWVALARSADPGVDFVVARLPYDWLYDGEVTAFNEMLDEMAADLSDEHSQVVVATMSESYTQGSDSSDHVHPNTSGQRKIASMIGGALAPLLEAAADPPADPLPEPPTEPLPVPPAPAPIYITVPQELAPPVVQADRPRAPRRVRAERVGRRVIVTWARARGVEVHVVRCGSRRMASTSRRAVLRSRSSRCSVRAFGESGASPWTRTRVKR